MNLNEQNLKRHKGISGKDVHSSSHSGAHIINQSIQYSGKRSKQRTRRTNTRRKQKRNGRRHESNGPISLPEVNNKPKQTRCVRYSGSLNGTTLWHSSDILAFAGFTNSGATAYYPLLDSFRLNRVGITLLPDSASSAGTVSFVWNGFNAPEFRETMLVTNGVPFTRSFFPTEGSSAWLWWDNSSTSTDLFSVRSATGSEVIIIIDIEITYIINTGAITNVPLTTTSAVTGLVYRTLPISSPAFVPVDLDTDT